MHSTVAEVVRRGPWVRWNALYSGRGPAAGYVGTVATADGRPGLFSRCGVFRGAGWPKVTVPKRVDRVVGM